VHNYATGRDGLLFLLLVRKPDGTNVVLFHSFDYATGRESPLFCWYGIILDINENYHRIFIENKTPKKHKMVPKSLQSEDNKKKKSPWTLCQHEDPTTGVGKMVYTYEN
jgi:hypothetical protein